MICWQSIFTCKYAHILLLRSQTLSKVVTQSSFINACFKEVSLFTLESTTYYGIWGAANNVTTYQGFYQHMKGGANTCQRQNLQHLSNNSMTLQNGGHISLQQKLTITVNKNRSKTTMTSVSDNCTIHIAAIPLK